MAPSAGMRPEEEPLALSPLQKPGKSHGKAIPLLVQCTQRSGPARAPTGGQSCPGTSAVGTAATAPRSGMGPFPVSCVAAQVRMSSKGVPCL